MPEDLKHWRAPRSLLERLDEAAAGAVVGTLCAAIFIFFVMPALARGIVRMLGG